MNDTDARETTRGDELLTGGSDPDPPEPDPLRERLRGAFIAGYLAREVDVRTDDPSRGRWPNARPSNGCERGANHDRV